VTSIAENGDIALHNHPSGRLQPSEPDLDIAARLADEGVAFAIVDNAVERAYVVVEPFQRSGVRPVDPREVQRLLGPSGPVARRLDGYEERPGQLAMAADVVEALNDDGIAMLEAGTGVGKSMAYLIPAAIWATRNKERVVVATGTINLQEQLIRHDLPLLKDALPSGVEAALIKGRGNYLGRRRLRLALEGTGTLLPDDQRDVLADIEAWAEQTEDGSLQDLTFSPPDALWQEVRSDGDACLRLRCPDYQECFYFKSRRRAARAGLLIVNHHLLFADVALRQASGNWKGSALLPPYQRVILDEGHRIEAAASSFFGGRVTRHGLLQSLGRLARFGKGRRDRGLLAALAARLPDTDQATRDRIHTRLMPAVGRARERAETEMRRLLLWLIDAAGSDDPAGSLRVTQALCDRTAWADVVQMGEGLAGDLRSLGGLVAELSVKVKGLTEEREDSVLDGMRIEIDAAARRLRSASQALEDFCGFDESGATDDGIVRWFEWSRRANAQDSALRLCTAPLEVGPSLESAVWRPFPTHVITSATLTTGPDGFDYLLARLGLDLIDADRVRQRVHPAPFDYGRQALVAIPTDLPDPGDAGFPEACAETVAEAVLTTKGRSFVLFTSHSLLRRVHELAEDRLREAGLNLLRQGDAPRTVLLERFRHEPGCVLFGTDSFWEGVDVRGDALVSVIITRLPFRVPTDPLVEARAEAIEKRGGNPFKEATIPAAVIKLKQGFGRLIRHRDDRGSVLLLDRRAVTRSYGRLFLEALPEGVSVRSGPRRDILAALAEFHAV
jgi:ATP-dependent DNA helicase DinG